MRNSFLLWMAIGSVCSFPALAAGGRSLPSGADDPAVIEKIYSTPRGEVHFVKMREGHSALLRNNQGYLTGLKEVRGTAACDDWFASDKNEAVPGACDFIFHDEQTGGLYSIRSEEMQEGSLFQAVRGTLRSSREIVLHSTASLLSAPRAYKVSLLSHPVFSPSVLTEDLGGAIVAL